MSSNVLLILLLNTPPTLSIWISPDSELPINNNRLAVGSYDDKVFMIGGFQYKRQIIEYEINTDTFIDLGDTTLTTDIFGEGQFWTQKQEILYMVRPAGYQIATFNMKTMQYEPNQYTFSTYVNDGACLSSSNDYLFVVGGDTASNGLVGLNTLQILNTESNEWIENTPSMQQQRTNHACIVHKDILWVFGGVFDRTALKTNEYIQINDIVQQSWQYIESLTDESNGLRAIAYEDYIYIMGGIHIESGVVLDTIHMYNVITNEMSLSNDRLAYPLRFMGTILIDNIIYHFAGYRSYADDGKEPYGVTNEWMYYDIPTSDPTSDPSEHPTEISTQFETTYNVTESNNKEDVESHVNVYTVIIIVLFVLVFMIITVLFLRSVYFDKHTEPEYAANVDILPVFSASSAAFASVNVSKTHLEDTYVVSNDGPMTNDVLWVKSWLETEVNLPIYYDIFINYGINTFSIVQSIDDEGVLEAIGIVSKEHRLRILNEVQKLNLEGNLVIQM